MFKDGGAAFPDLSGDGKITQKDILMGRGVQFMENGGPPSKMASPAVEEANFLRQRLFDIASGGTIGQVQTFIRNNLNEMETAGLFRNRFVRGLIENVTGMSPEEVAAGGMVPPPMAPLSAPMANPAMMDPRVMSPQDLIRQTPDDRIINEPEAEALNREAMFGGPGAPIVNIDPAFSEMAEEQNRRAMERMGNLPIGKQEGGVIEPPMMDPAMMAGGSPAQMMMAEQQVMDAPPEIQQAAAEEIQAGLPMVENALNQFAMNTGGKDVEDAETFEEMMNMVRGFPATTSERREELAELVGPEDASQTPDSVLAMVQPIIGLTALDQGIGSLAREEMGEAPPMGGIMDMAAAPGGMMVEESIPV